MANQRNTKNPEGKSKRGFAAMDRTKQRKISQKGGKARGRSRASEGEER